MKKADKQKIGQKKNQFFFSIFTFLKNKKIAKKLVLYFTMITLDL